MTQHLRYLFPRTINARQMAAGNAWYEDWIDGGAIMTAKPKTNVRDRILGKLAKPEGRIAASQRFQAGSQAIGDPELRWHAVQVVLKERRLGDLADERATGTAEIGEKLREALDRLARAYDEVRF